MPASYTGQETAANRNDVTINTLPLDGESRNASSLHEPFKGVLNYLQRIIKKAGFLDLASTWSAEQTFEALKLTGAMALNGTFTRTGATKGQLFGATDANTLGFADVIRESIHKVGDPGEIAYYTAQRAIDTTGFWYYKANGVVYVWGGVRTNTAYGTIFVLPAGYRPPFDVKIPTVDGSATGCYWSIAGPGVTHGHVILSGANAPTFINTSFSFVATA